MGRPFLDDVYVVNPPERVRVLYNALAAALWAHARIRLHEGKTRIWNAAGEEPPNIADLAADSEPVWVGDWSLPRIRLHEGKTRIWNAAGEEPPNIADLAADSEPVWVGDWSLPPQRQGLKVLGSPLGHGAFVARQLNSKREEQDRLLQRIPALDSLQAAWLLLLFCAAPRANYLLRILLPI
eukprot:s4313_g7.t1